MFLGTGSHSCMLSAMCSRLLQVPLFMDKNDACSQLLHRGIYYPATYMTPLTICLLICLLGIFCYFKGEFNADLKMLLYSPSPGFN